MKPDVVVVGGGPCGLLVALLLGRQGVQTVLIEKHAQVLDHPRAMGVMRRTNEIFMQLGLLDAVMQGGMRSSPDALSIWFRGAMTGEELGRARMPDDDTQYSPCFKLHCPQPHIEKVLRRAVLECPSVKCLFGYRLDSFEQGPDGVRVSLTPSGQQADRPEPDPGVDTMHARYMVAADGDRSAIRDALGIVRRGPGERGRFLSVYFQADLTQELQGRMGLLCNVVDSEMFEAFVAVDGQSHWLMHHFLDAQAQHQEHTSDEMRAVIAQACGIEASRIQVLSMNPWVMSPSVAPVWRKDRVFLVGDAAARVSPAGGLGMNNGLQSAHNLAWKLGHVVRGSAPDALLDSYEAERLPAARFTFENSEGNSSEVFRVVEAAMSGRWDEAREIVRHSRRAAPGYGQDFGIVYESTAMIPDDTEPLIASDVVNEYIAQARPGHRAPHFMIQVDDRTESVLSLLDYRYTALLGPKAEFSQYKRLWPSAIQIADGRDFTASSDWLDLYGISEHGAVLVRPDGYVAAREACR